MSVKLSVIVPVYNVEKYLDRCIHSILNQTFKDIEIILVDDGSRDNSPALCDEYSKHYKNIIVVHKENGGLGFACNTGLDAASGKYIAFLDSDDWIDSEMYKTLINTAEEYKAQLVFSGLKRVNDKGEVFPLSSNNKKRIYKTLNEVQGLMMDMIASKPSVKEERRIQMSAKVVLYDKEFIEKHHIRFESEREFISEDLLFNLDNLNKASCVVEIPNIFYNYYVNELSITKTFRKDRFEKYIKMHEELLHRYDLRTEDFTNRVHRMLIGYIRSTVRNICLADISYKEKKELVHKISKSKVLNEIINNYPINLMPKTHRIFLSSILKNRFIMLILMTRLKK